MTTRARKGRILVYTNSIGAKPIDPSNIQHGAVIVYDEVNQIYKYINLNEIFALIDHNHDTIYLQEITIELVEAVLTGNISSHTHSQYITAITKTMVEAVLTGDITSHSHSIYALATHNHDGTYLTAITKVMVEAVLTGNITSHTHSLYLTAITKTMVEAVLTGDITSHSHSIYALATHNHDGTYLTSITKAMVEAVLTGAITSHTHAYEPIFSKNTAFNKNFGAAAGTVAEGNHTHAAYLTAITKAMVEAVLTGDITSHSHSIYALALHNHDGTYLSAITKAMVEAVLTGAITSHTHAYEPIFSKNTGFNKNFGAAAGTVAEGNHTHAAYLTAITKAMVEAVLTGSITSHMHIFISIPDTRGAQRQPDYYTRNAVRWDFTDSASTLATGDGWQVLMTVSPWSSWHSSHRPSQIVFVGSGIKFRESTSDTTWGTWKDIILGDDSRLTNARPASDVYAWAKASTKPAYLYSEVGAARALGRVISDFNHADFRVPGMYGMNNVPANGYGYSYGALIVAANSDTGLQISGGYSHDELHFRGWWSSGAGYGTWRKIWHNGNTATLKTALGTMPASDVYAWAKASSKPSYSAAEVGAAATNDSRLSDARTPTDLSVTYAKVANTLKAVATHPWNTATIDFSANSIYYITLAGNAVYSYSNLQTGKVLTLIVSGDHLVGFPAYFKRITGGYDGSKINYIQIHCTNAATPECWMSITQEAT